MYKYIYPLIKWKIKPWIKHYIINKSKAGKLLPDEYQQVEYIKSSGTQYIDTGYKPNNNTKYDITASFINTSGNKYIISAIDSTYRSNLYIHNPSGNTYGSSYGTTNFSGYTYAEYLIKQHLILDKNLFYVNDILNNTFPSSNFQCSVNAMLFARNNRGSIDFFTSMQLYECKFYDNDILVRDFIPCYRKLDNVVGLYDIVNNVFYTNVGSGTFEKGSDV